MFNSNKKVYSTQDMISERAMDILRPLYQKERLFYNLEKNKVEFGYSDKVDNITKTLLSKLVDETSKYFVKPNFSNDTYSSMLFSLSVEYKNDPEVSASGLVYDKDKIKFFDDNKKDMISKANKYCEQFCMDFSDIPHFNDSDRLIKSNENKLAIAKFVMNNEYSNIHTNIQQYRDELEKIPRLVISKDNSKLKVNNVGKSNSIDLER